MTSTTAWMVNSALRSGLSRVAFVLATAFAVAFSTGNPAQAAVTDNIYPTANYNHICSGGHYGDAGLGFCLTDNNYFTWGGGAESSITDGGGILGALIDLDGTDLSVYAESPPVYSGSSETDVIYQAGALPAGAGGMTWCDNADNYLMCDQHYVRFWTGGPSRYLACHETGHSVGLTHGPEASPALDINDARLACMNYVQNDPLLGYNNYDNINAVY